MVRVVTSFLFTSTPAAACHCRWPTGQARRTQTVSSCPWSSRAAALMWQQLVKVQLASVQEAQQLMVLQRQPAALRAWGQLIMILLAQQALQVCLELCVSRCRHQLWFHASSQARAAWTLI